MKFGLEEIHALVPKVLDWGTNILTVVLIFVIGRWLAKKASSLAVAALEKAGVDATLRTFAGTVVRYAILVVVVIAILERFGIETTSFVAVMAAAGFAVGLAMQGTLSSFSSGVLLLLFRPFNVGDVVNAGGVSGRVEHLQIFTTVFGLPDGSKIFVPNSQIYGSTIHNKSPGGGRMSLAVSLGAAYDADIDRTREVLTEMVNSLPKVLEGTGHCVLTGLGASSVDWSVRCAVHPDDYWSVLEAVTVHAKKALDAAGIGIPYNTLDVHIVGDAE